MSYFNWNARYDKLRPGDHLLVNITDQGDIRRVSVNDFTEYLKEDHLSGFQVNYFQMNPVPISQLPSNPKAGMRAAVTDCAGNVFGDFVVAGGSYVLPVFYNGSDWIIG